MIDQPGDNKSGNRAEVVPVPVKNAPHSMPSVLQTCLDAQDRFLSGAAVLRSEPLVVE